LVENHELPTIELNNLFDEFNPKSCKSVSVGNHNVELIAAHCAFQKGCKSFPFEVETAADIFDNFSGGIFSPHEFDLSFKVVALFGTGDATVADGDSCAINVEKLIEVITSLSCGGSNAFDLSTVCPFS
jgi:hypothetical protein